MQEIENPKTEIEEAAPEESILKSYDAETKSNEEKNEVDIPAIESTDEIVQTVTILDTPKGSISVVHDITLGDLILSTILMAYLIFNVINQLARRS